MKSIVTGILIIIGLSLSVSAYSQFNYHDASTWLLGELSPDMLQEPPHMEWYNRGFDEYNPDLAPVGTLISIDKSDVSITIVMGTWCPDTRREFPRFMKLMALWGFPLENIRIIGVDSNKKAPLGDYDLLDIKKVPTFIIYKNKVEAGRIIEYPVTSLERDLVDILGKTELTKTK